MSFSAPDVAATLPGSRARASRATVAVAAIACAVVAADAPARPPASLLSKFTTVSQVASTVPGNGDVNPYGVFVAPTRVGKLVRDHVLVSNFNDAGNAQGTGTTIVDVAPDGTTTLFAQIDPTTLPGPCPGGVGLTTALVVLRRGFVVVGSLPTTDGKVATAQPGCLLVLDSTGKVVETFAGGDINGPWDMTVREHGHKASLFVTNVLNGPVTTSPSTTVIDQGTVVRVDLDVPPGSIPQLLSETVIGSGFGEHGDPDALVVGPTGVGLGARGTLYVADTVANRIAAISNADSRESSAGTGSDVAVGGALDGPLGLAVSADNGNILTANGGDGNLVETTPGGVQIGVMTVNPNGGGALFGLAFAPHRRGIYLVDDASNALDLLHD